uniref:Uncharacterized protein n=1 Tax=Knipowitschia caucasica TaxID=637954 RepID=A0AAV2LBZ6_KNICA
MRGWPGSKPGLGGWGAYRSDAVESSDEETMRVEGIKKSEGAESKFEPWDGSGLSPREGAQRCEMARYDYGYCRLIAVRG